MKKQIRESKFKRQLHSVQSQVDISKYLKIPTKCPYCGGRMIIKTIGDYMPGSCRADTPFCVCEHYDDTCSCSVKLKKDSNGKLIPCGIPADNHLKSLRCEAHFYIDYLVRLHVMESTAEVYDWLAGEFAIQRRQFHMSMFLQGRCQAVILKALELLAANPEKTSNRVWIYQSQFPDVKSFSSTNPTAITLLQQIHAKMYDKVKGNTDC